MDGIHDLGGMEGFGQLPLEENEPVKQAWTQAYLATPHGQPVALERR